MNSIVQIVRQKIWWILLALVILGLFFFRHSIFGFKVRRRLRGEETCHRGVRLPHLNVKLINNFIPLLSDVKTNKINYYDY
jgi:hypothetical protein